MKKIILLVIVVSTSLFSFGQWTNSGSSSITYESTGEVGVISKANSNGTYGAANIIVDAANGFPSRFLFRNSGQNKAWFDYYSNKVNLRNAQNQTLFTVLINNGNFGIGSKNPDSKLTVKGKIHCEEVKVDLSVPADYVFEKYYNGTSTLKADYTMPTLKEVEAYTKENHHLPAMPSAKEIQENGLYLKEMTNLLLQKIEELTLYTIEQEKRINALESKLSSKE